MQNGVAFQSQEIKKLHVEATVMFAVNHIPSVDEPTLIKFLELVNVTGNFGTISEEQLVQKMQLILKHIPGASEASLITLGELLNIRFPEPVEEPAALPSKNGKVVGVINPIQERELQRMAW